MVVLAKTVINQGMYYLTQINNLQALSYKSNNKCIKTMKLKRVIKPITKSKR